MFKMIVAHCRNGGIGKNGRLPWAMCDIEHFKKLTIGNKNNAIIMGKNTWLGLSKRPLPHRDNLILSRTLKGDNIFASVGDIKNYCREKKYDEAWVIGGEDVYTQWLKSLDLESVYITEIEQNFDCDTFFPPMPTWFYEVSRSGIQRCNNLSFNYYIYWNGWGPGGPKPPPSLTSNPWEHVGRAVTAQGWKSPIGEIVF